MADHHDAAHHADHVARSRSGSAGVGSAMNDTTRELGGALGVAVLGSLVHHPLRLRLAPAVAGLPEQAR